MNSYIYAAPCHFGLESVLKREIQGLGCKIVSVDDGRVTFEGDADTAAAANIKLRTAERILLLVDEFRAVTYDELFEKTKAVHWEEFLPRDAKFWVAKASSVKSALFSPSDIQRIIKKAMADRMSAHYGYRWAPETGAAYPLRVAIRKDVVTLGLDTTGTSLHKRGYRISPVIAPISETLAAALILLTPWRQGRILVDPFCGSGTFPIEAAMIAGNIAPGVRREFLSEKWDSILPEDSFRRAREQARAEEIPVTDTDIQGYDIDPKAVKAARENAREAGVLSYLHFQRRAVADLSHSGKYGFIITNPPYGERIEDRANLPELYGALGEAYRKLDTWSMYVITAYDQAENGIGLKSSKNRKIYNGMMKTYLYEYIGPKPPKSRVRDAHEEQTAVKPLHSGDFEKRLNGDVVRGTWENREYRRSKMKIIFATGNENKLTEIRKILNDLDVEVISMKEAGIKADIVEDGKTFAENALIKARTICKACGEITMSDDSGLVIDALGGEPGIYSARYMGEDTSYHIKNNNLIERLQGVPDEKRTARFMCDVACVFPDGREIVCEGTFEGRIGYEEKGSNGFGYDPIFFVPEKGCTSAELSPSEKNAISHRGKALRAMRAKLGEML